MSLFSTEEICIGCKYSVWHECCKRFCKCEIDKEYEIDHIRGDCKFRTEEEV